MLKNKKIIIPLTILSLLIFIFAAFLVIDSLSSNVSKDEWQSTPELALTREAKYGAEYINADNTAKTADVLQVKLMLDKVEIEGKNTVYAIFLSKADIFTVAKLIKDPATGKWKYHSTLLYEKDLSNPGYIYNSQEIDCTLQQEYFKDIEAGCVFGLKFRDNATVQVNGSAAKMKTYVFVTNAVTYSIDLWYVTDNLPTEEISLQYKSN